jgi:hypothetical protein
MSRLSTLENLEGVRIDFSGEEVTNLASLQEVEEAVDVKQAINEDNVERVLAHATPSIVRYYPLMEYCTLII